MEAFQANPMAESLFVAPEGSLLHCEPSLLIALLSLFDFNGTGALSDSEWQRGNQALENQTSDAEFEELCNRFGRSTEDGETVLDYRKALGIFGARKPIEGHMEDLMRRLMKSLMAMTARIVGLEEILQRTSREAEVERERRLGRVMRTWRHRHTSMVFDAWHTFVSQRRRRLDCALGHLRHRLLSAEIGRAHV